MDDWILSITVALVGAGFGAGIARYLSHRRERTELTMELFRSYHSPELIAARNVSWRYLNVDYLSDRRPFHELFSDVNELGTSHYNDLIQVLYFWYQLHCLQQEKAISEPLAMQFFRYQFAHWRRAIEPLFAATRSDPSDDPEWCRFMEPGAMDWLLARHGG